MPGGDHVRVDDALSRSRSPLVREDDRRRAQRDRVAPSTITASPNVGDDVDEGRGTGLDDAPREHVVVDHACAKLAETRARPWTCQHAIPPVSPMRNTLASSHGPTLWATSCAAGHSVGPPGTPKARRGPT